MNMMQWSAYRGRVIYQFTDELSTRIKFMTKAELQTWLSKCSKNVSNECQAS